MSDKMMRVAGRNEEGLAKPLSVNNVGNLKTSLGSRNEMIFSATETVNAVGTKSVVSRLGNLKDYSAIVVGVNTPSKAKIRLEQSWYMQKADEQYGLQVTKDVIMIPTEITYFASDYLEVRGTQVSIIVGNSSALPIDVTVFVMGIK